MSLLSATMAYSAEPAVAEKPSLISNLSVETLGVIRHNNIHDGVTYGAGVQVGYSFNKYVTGIVGAIAYEEPNHWGGTAVDEGSLLVMATLLSSKSGGISLSAIGGAFHRFDTDDWGFGVGPRLDISLTENFGIFGQSMIQAYDKGGKALESGVGLFLTF